jgi:hypothetical protein
MALHVRIERVMMKIKLPLMEPHLEIKQNKEIRVKWRVYFLLQGVFDFIICSDSSVGIATAHVLDRRSSFPGRDKIFFVYSTASRPALGLIQSPIQLVSSDLSPGVKW